MATFKKTTLIIWEKWTSVDNIKHLEKSTLRTKTVHPIEYKRNPDQIGPWEAANFFELKLNLDFKI